MTCGRISQRTTTQLEGTYLSDDLPIWEHITRATVDQELSEARDSGPIDHNADSLPFSQLGGARFELLVFLLLETENPAPSSVTLLKASGDRGRDVLVYSDGGLRRIVQCKNQQDRLNEPTVISELLKVALHAHLAVGVLPAFHDGAPKVEIEFWAPAGFTEPAAEFIDTWPKAWTEERVTPAFTELSRTYARFKSIDWETVQSKVIDQFAKAIAVRKVIGPSISNQVRRHVAVYQQFFRGTVLAQLPDVEQALRSVLQGVDWRSVTDEDVRRVIDHIGNFPKENRLFLGKGYLLGMSPEFLGQLTHDEFGKIAEDVLLTAPRIADIAIQAAERMVRQLIMNSFQSLPVRNRSFTFMVMQFALFRFLKRLSAGSSNAIGHAELASRGLTDLGAELPRLAQDLWAAFQQALSPNTAPFTTDTAKEAAYVAVAKYAVAGYSNSADFLQEATEDYQNFRSETDALLHQVEKLLPSDLMLISDLGLVIDQQHMLKAVVDVATQIGATRAVEASSPLHAQRGSAPPLAR